MHSRRIKKKVKEDYNEIADSFSGTRYSTWKDFDFFLPYYDADADVLDLGCGNGRILEFLEKHGYAAYLGVDQSEKLIEIARVKHPKVKFAVADMADVNELGDALVSAGLVGPVDLVGRKFSVIFAIASFHHIPPREQLATLRAWHDLLEGGGYLFMTNWNLWQPRFWPLFLKAALRFVVCPCYGLRGLLIPWQNQVRRYYYAFTRRRLKHLLEKAGFWLVYQTYANNGKCANLLSGKNIITIARKKN